MWRYEGCRFCGGDGCLACPGEEARAQGRELPISRPTVIIKSPSAKGQKLIARFRGWADKMSSQIENKSRPLSQDWTPKRGKEFNSRLHDAANLRRGQAALRAMADALEEGTLPDVLAGVRFKKDILPMVRTSIKSQNYYEVYDSGVYSRDDVRAVALQQLVGDVTTDLKDKVRSQKLAHKAKMLEGQVPGFFSTPRVIAEQMVRLAGLEKGRMVLEPSAGAGAIADVVRELHPDAVLHCIERSLSLQEILRAKGHNVVAGDFLEYAVNGWDAIIQNPPFEKGQDMAHVRHAYGLLAEGGRLVSVVVKSCFYNSAKKFQAFRDWLDFVGYECVDLLRDAFKESGSGAKARIVVVERSLHEGKKERC